MTICPQCAVKHHKRCSGETEACGCACSVAQAWAAWWMPEEEAVL